jgi:hypothetical protein
MASGRIDWVVTVATASPRWAVMESDWLLSREEVSATPSRTVSRNPPLARASVPAALHPSAMARSTAMTAASRIVASSWVR